MKLKISGKEIQEILDLPVETFPKYATQILNLANQNAQGTRPKIVGQLSDLIQEFSGKTLTEWENWYLAKHPDAIEKATEKINNMVELFRELLNKIDKKIIEKWVKDLIIVKTFIGLKFQEAVLKKVAEVKNESYRLASFEEESKGIDGFIGDKPVSIKPLTYKSKMALSEQIYVDLIFYEKKRNDLFIEFDF